MEFKEALEKLKNDSKFREWKKKNPKCYLAHVFIGIEKTGEDWQVGYFNPDTDKMTAFIFEGEAVNISEELDVFKKPDSAVKKLDTGKIKIPLKKALEIAEKVMKEKYAGNDAVKSFLIVQNIEEGNVFNITFVSQKFNTINVRIDGETGKVLKHQISSLMDLGQMQPGNKGKSPANKPAS